jgi:hypothetical protein
MLCPASQFVEINEGWLRQLGDIRRDPSRLVLAE